MSGNYKSILMWSHYANEHKGFCIGFDTDLDPTLKESAQVHYTSSLPRISAFRLDDPDLAESIIKDLVYTKAEDWRYEDEWRCVVDTRDGDRLRKISPSSITKIVFGAKISQNNKNEIAELVNRYIPHALQIQLRCHDTAYELIEDSPCTINSSGG